MNQPAQANQHNIAVAGAGMVGIATAIRLQQDGCTVTVIDPLDTARAASFGNAGALNPSSVTPLTAPGLLRQAPRMLLDRNSPLFLRWRYFPRVTPWLLRFLAHATRRKAAAIADGLTPLVDQCLNEHWALVSDTPAAPLLNAREFTALYRNRAAYEADQYVWSERKRLGLSWQIVEGESFRSLEPELADHADFAVRMGEHGFIADPGRYLETLLQHFQSCGGAVIKGAVDKLVTEGDRAKAVKVDGRDIAVDKVVITAGIHSSKLTRPLGLKIPMESERGYHIELVEPSFKPRGVVNLTDLKIFMTPMDGRLRCTSVVEFAGVQAPENRKIYQIMQDKLTRAFPELRWKSINTWMGHRPSLVDSLPVIGAAPGFKNIYLGYGHNHVGMMSGPRTGRILADLIAGRTLDVDISPYDARRFL